MSEAQDERDFGTREHVSTVWMSMETGTPANELRNIVLKTYSKTWHSPLCEPKSFGRELAKGHELEGRRPI